VGVWDFFQPLGGLVILSSFVGPSDDLKYEAKLPPTNLKVPFFWGHGHADAVVPFAFGKVGVDQLKQVGVGAVCLVHSLVLAPSSSTRHTVIRVGLESRHVESRAKAARLDLEAAVGWVCPSSHGLWGVNTLLPSTRAVKTRSSRVWKAASVGWQRDGGWSGSQLGYAIEFKSYPGLAHSACPEEMRDVTAFIRASLRPKPSADEVAAFSVKELKAYLGGCGVDYSTCFEKSELLSLAKNTL
jgi:hypothetical protein